MTVDAYVWRQTDSPVALAHAFASPTDLILPGAACGAAIVWHTLTINTVQGMSCASYVLAWVDALPIHAALTTWASCALTTIGYALPIHAAVIVFASCDLTASVYALPIYASMMLWASRRGAIIGYALTIYAALTNSAG